MSAPTGAGQGYNYWGCYAIALCWGPVATLHSVSNGETVIWTGPINSDSADGNGATVINTTMGALHFYWGTPGQGVDALLATLSIDRGAGLEIVPMSAFRYLCYAVANDLNFGGTVTPPTLTFELERHSDGLAISAHHIAGDAIMPETIFDLLIHPIYGLGVAPAYVDSPSFVSAAETIITEELAASPDIDSPGQAREIIGQMQSNVDGFAYFQDGKFRFKLNRPVTSITIPVVDESALTEEPKPSPDQFEGTWNKTILTFKDRTNKWEDTSEEYDHAANGAIVGEKNEKQVNFPWVTQRTVAKKLVKMIGIKAGVPAQFYELNLKPSWANVLHVGDVFPFTFTKFGLSEMPMRVKKVTRGKPSDGTFTVECQVENIRDTSHDYVIPEDEFGVPGTVDENGTGDFAVSPATPRLSILPSGLKEGLPDGLLVAESKPGSNEVGGSVYWTYDPLLSPYKLIGNVKGFPAKGTIMEWHRIRATHWTFRLTMDTPRDADRLTALVANATQVLAVVGERDFRTSPAKNEHQVLSPWLSYVPGGRFVPVAGFTNVFDIEMQGGEFGSDDLRLETLAADGYFATIHIYFGRKEDFIIILSSAIQFERPAGNAPGDTDEKRYIKTPMRNWKRNQEDIASLTPVVYDRNDTTMSPDGTFSRDWGAAAPLGYELFDTEAGLTVENLTAATYNQVEDFDTALGAIFGGTATADQTLMAEHIDDVLGLMASTNQVIYTAAP